MTYRSGKTSCFCIYLASHCLENQYLVCVHWGCVKSLFMALRAKFKFETDVFFMILLRKIMKNTSVSN